MYQHHPAVQLSSCPTPRERLKDLIHGIEATARQALRHLHPGHGRTGTKSWLRDAKSQMAGKKAGQKKEVYGDLGIFYDILW